MAMATVTNTLSPPKNLLISDSGSDETDADSLSPRFITTPVDTPMSIAGAPFMLETQCSTISQQSKSSSSSEEMLVTVITTNQMMFCNYFTAVHWPCSTMMA